jgi:hypothetical protein
MSNVCYRVLLHLFALLLVLRCVALRCVALHRSSYHDTTITTTTTTTTTTTLSLHNRSLGKHVTHRRGSNCCNTTSTSGANTKAEMSALNVDNERFFLQLIAFVAKAKSLRKITFESVSLSNDTLFKLGRALSTTTSHLHWVGFKCCKLGSLHTISHHVSQTKIVYIHKN